MTHTTHHDGCGCMKRRIIQQLISELRNIIKKSWGSDDALFMIRELIDEMEKRA